MKRFKLFSTLFIVVCLLSLCLSVSATGLEETYDVSFTVEASASTVSASGTFKVTVAVDKNDGFKYARPVLKYNPEVLTLVSSSIAESAFKTSSGANAVSVREVADTPGMISIEIGSYSDIFNLDPNVYYAATGTVAVLEFKVAEGLANGTNIKVDLEVLSENVMHPKKSVDYEKYVCTVYGDSVTVTCSNAHTCDSKVSIPGKEATCSATGLTEGKKCSVCGTVTVEQTEISKLPHTEVTVSGTAPTCTVDGRKDFIYCSVCEVTIQAAETIKAPGHTWQDATCTTAKTCSVCGATEGTAAGHKLEPIPAVPSTCVVAGSTAGEKCSVCGTVTKQPTALGLAEHKYDIVIKGTAATCTTTGKKDGAKCSVCGDVKEGSVIARLGHKIVEHDRIAPTCTEEGKTAWEECSRCGIHLSEPAWIQPTGHDFGSWTDAGENHKKVCLNKNCNEYKVEDHHWDSGVVVKEAAENEDGEMKFTCIVCAATKSQVIPGLNHEHKYTSATTAATCTEDGFVVYTCACGDTYTEAGETAPGHAWVDATCTTAKTCSVCNTVEGEPLGHSFGEWVFMDEPTATKEGSKSRVCTLCGLTETESIPALGTEPATTGPVDTTAPTGTDEPANNSNTILIVAIVALFVAAGAIIVLLVLKKK